MFATRARFVPDVFVAIRRIWAKAQFASIRPIVAQCAPERPDRQVNQPSTSSSGHGTRTTLHQGLVAAFISVVDDADRLRSDRVTHAVELGDEYETHPGTPLPGKADESYQPLGAVVRSPAD